MIIDGHMKLNHDIMFRLPSKLYPEYHNVHKMMAGEATSSTSMYQPLQQTRILEISQDKKIRMIRENNQEIIVKVTFENRTRSNWSIDAINLI